MVGKGTGFRWGICGEGGMRYVVSVASGIIELSVEEGVGDSATGSCGPCGSVTFVLGTAAPFLFF